MEVSDGGLESVERGSQGPGASSFAFHQVAATPHSVCIQVSRTFSGHKAHLVQRAYEEQSQETALCRSPGSL